MGNLLANENDVENGGDNGNGANGGNGNGDEGAEWLQTAGRFIWKGKWRGDYNLGEALCNGLTSGQAPILNECINFQSVFG
jgi:hypothetical protein